MLDTPRSLVRHAVRRLLRAPAFSVTASLTLALGIGGTVAVFSVVETVLLRPLPYVDAGQLVDLAHTLEVGGVMHVDQSDATYLTYRRDNRVFADVGAYRETSANVHTSLAGGAAATPERVATAEVTASVFHVLHVPMLRGRALTSDDDRPGATPVVVIGEGLWRRAFGADASIVGRHIAVDGVDRAVVGVLPTSFRFPAPETALWVPMALDPARTKSAAFDYRGIARLRPGGTVEAAAADLQRLLPQVPVEFPGRLTAGAIAATHMSAVVRPLRDVMVGDVAHVLWIVLGAVVALLLVACANVASLFLARAEGRRRELAVRRALGAGRGALLADFLSEAFVLSAVGGAVGVVLAAIGLRVLQASGAATTLPRLDEIHLDGAVGGVAVLITGVTALLVSALPLARGGSSSLSAILSSHNPGASGGRLRQRARRALVVTQVALALMLLASAGLFARSFANLRAVDPGFAAAQAISFRLALPPATYPAAGDVARVVQATVDALQALPGVAAAGVTTKLPLDDEARQDSAVFVEDHPLVAGEFPSIHGMAFVTPEYFRAMGIPIRAGRSFSPLDPSLDPSTQPREVVVSQALADRYWKTVNPVGRRVRMNIGDPWATIVGVVGSVRDAGLDQEPAAEVYSPIVTRSASGAPWAPRDVAFVVRARGDVSALLPSIRAAVATVAPALPVYRVVAMRDVEQRNAARTTFTLFLLGVAAGMATIVAAAGIYGVISYLVSLRRREIGVRLALGSTPSRVRMLVVRHAMADTVTGVVIGLASVAVFARLLTSALFGVSATDPWALAGGAVVLILTAALASWLPAQRAAAVDPAAALRSE